MVATPKHSWQYRHYCPCLASIYIYIKQIATIIAWKERERKKTWNEKQVSREVLIAIQTANCTLTPLALFFFFLSAVAKVRVVRMQGQLVATTAGETRDDAAIQARLLTEDAPVTAHVDTTPLAKLNLVNCEDNRKTLLDNILRDLAPNISWHENYSWSRLECAPTTNNTK